MARSIVEISGHIIDSLILPKILDLIISLGAEFEDCWKCKSVSAGRIVAMPVSRSRLGPCLA